MTPRQLFLRERDIPYRIPLTTDELNDSCAGKHERLLHAFQQIGLESRYRICRYRWSDLNLSKELNALPHENESTHLYLETLIDQEWRTIDATWDSAIDARFEVNEWDPRKDMKIAVPAFEILSPEASAEYMQKLTAEEAQMDLEKNGAFYHAFNLWLEQLRGANSCRIQHLGTAI